MGRAELVILESDHAAFTALLEKLALEANAKFAFLLDRNGQQIALAGDLGEIDPTSLASLAAGNVAATEGLAQLIGENAISSLFHEGERDSLHLSMIAGKMILLVIFDEHSSLGLVRLRVKQRTPDLVALIDAVTRRGAEGAEAPGDALVGITDEDIEALFG